MADPAYRPPPAETAPREGTARAGLPNANYLLESLVGDLHALAQQVGTLATLVTATLRPNANWTLRSCRHLLHGDVMPMTLVLRFSAQMGLDAEAARRFGDLSKAVAAAQARLVPLLQFSGANKAQRAQIEAASLEWRRLASGMAAALAAIEPLARARLHAVYAEDLAVLRVFLAQAAEAEASGADAAGVVKAPVLKQRRRDPRVVVKAPCSVETAGGLQQARLEDVSRHGMGLSCSLPLAIGQKVVVVPEDGRRLSATVVRGQNGRFGLALEAPLAQGDALLVGGR